MKRPETAVMVTEVTPPPSRAPKAKSKNLQLVEAQKQLLEINPSALVADNLYPRATAEESLASVKAAMYTFNRGGRRHFPADKYYAIWQDSAEDPNVKQLMIGLRSHMHPDWESKVNGAGSRSKKDEGVADDPFTPAYDEDESED